jgi:hypothetical protein
MSCHFFVLFFVKFFEKLGKIFFEKCHVMSCHVWSENAADSCEGGGNPCSGGGSRNVTRVTSHVTRVTSRVTQHMT